MLDLARGSIDAVRRRLIGEPTRYEPPLDAAQQIEQFLESLSLETIDLGTFEPRLVRLCHALDHLNQLHDDLMRIPSDEANGQPSAGFDAGAQALAIWLDATTVPETTSDPAIFNALEDSSKQLSAERETSRDKTLEDVALQRVPISTARAQLETLAWADGALCHAWRLTESLRLASGNPAVSLTR